MKIALIGDSIRQNYAPATAEFLGEDFQVFNPTDNCRFAKYMMRCIFDWTEQMKGARIVQFNCGHWDLNNLFGDGPFTSLEEYGNTMIRIAKLLLSRHEKVVFATTTPTDPKNEYNKNNVIIEFNEYIVPKLRELGVIINDLHKLTYSDIEKYIRQDDKIHLTDEGKRVCAEETARLIRSIAAELPQNAPDIHTDGKNSDDGYAVVI